MKNFLVLIFFLFLSITFSKEQVYFINLGDGDVVKSPVFIQFGLAGKGIAPAGVIQENTGHHHLLIDVKDIDFSMPIPTSQNHLHFGAGQTETTLELDPGQYQFQLVLGDAYHMPLSPPLISEKITVIVK